MFEVGQDENVPVREAVLHDRDLYEADEAFLTSSTRELVPIVQVGDHVIATGLPGRVTGQLLEGFRKKAKALAQSAPAARA